MTEWEYHVENITLSEKWFSQQQEWQRFVDRFNQIGSVGYELVSYAPVAIMGGMSGQHKTNWYLAIFKRPKVPAAPETGSGATPEPQQITRGPDGTSRCPACGKVVLSDAELCRSCGQRLISA